MRTQAFWKTKRAKAQQRVRTLQLKIDWGEMRQRWLEERLRHKSGPELRAKRLKQRFVLITLLAKRRRELKALQWKKIPHYVKMLNQKPKTIWNRIRKGGLYLTTRLSSTYEETTSAPSDDR